MSQLKTFTNTEKERVKELRNSGLSYKAIAEAIGRNTTNVRYWLLSPEEREKRNDARKEYKKTYNASHKEERLLYRQTHAEEIGAYKEEYRKTHREQHRICVKRYEQANQEKIIQRRTVFRVAHKEELRQKNKAYREANKEKVLAGERAYRKSTKGKVSRINKEARRYAREKDGRITGQQWEDLLSGQEGRCVYCGRIMLRFGNEQTSASLDHVVPLSKGGPHDIQNCVLCCRQCNSEKGAKDLSMFLFEKGYSCAISTA